MVAVRFAWSGKENTLTLERQMRLESFSFRIANAPWVFHRVMPLAFANFGQQSGLLVYMDNVIASSATWEAHLRLLEGILRALRTASLTLKPYKTHFRPKEVHYLGHVLSANDIRIGEDRIKVIVDFKTPTTIKELRSVLSTIISYESSSQIWQRSLTPWLPFLANQS